MISELHIPTKYVNIAKIFFFMIIIYFPILIYFGVYYYLSNYINKKVKSLILSKLSNSPYISKYIYIIGIIVRFIIFFGLLKLILQVSITYLFFNFEESSDLNCEMSKMSKNLATYISVMFFIIYEIILLPFGFINNVEKIVPLIINISKMFIDYFIKKLEIKKLKDPNNIINIEGEIKNLNSLLSKLNIFKKDYSNKAESDVNKIIEIMTNNIKSTNESYIVKFGNIFTSLFSEPITEPYKKIEDNINSIASSVSGKIIIPLFYLGIIYLTLYYFLTSWTIIRIILFVIIVIVFLVYLYIDILIFVFDSILGGIVFGMDKIQSGNKLNNIRKDIKLLKFDISDIIFCIINLFKNMVPK